MIVTRLNALELKKWNKWLKVSHGIDAWSGHAVYQCALDYTLFLTPIRSLVGLCARNQHNNDGVVASFEISPGIRTIANVWGKPLATPVGTCVLTDRDSWEKELISLASTGNVWWGTEQLNDSPWMTSILYVAPEILYFPPDVGEIMKDSTPPPQFLETQLDLI
jgi:hypothetical protein